MNGADLFSDTWVVEWRDRVNVILACPLQTDSLTMGHRMSVDARAERGMLAPSRRRRHGRQCSRARSQRT